MKKIDWSIRPELQEMVKDGIISEAQAREVIMQAQRKEDEKKRDELQAMFSSVHKAPISLGSDGRWKTKVKTPEGKRKQIAKQSILDIEKALNLYYFGTESPEKRNELITIRHLYPIWLEEKKQIQEASTIKSIDSKWRNDIEPFPELVDVPIKRLNVDIVKTWALQLLNGTKERPGLKVQHFYNVKAVVNEVLDKAVDREIVHYNVSRNTKIAGMKKRKAQEKKARMEAWKAKEEKRQIAKAKNQKSGNKRTKKNAVTMTVDEDTLDDIITMTDDELVKFETAAWSLAHKRRTFCPLLYLMLLFAREVGLRVGELLELKHGDVRNGILHVSRFYAYAEDSRDEKTGERVCVVKDWLKNYKEKREIPLTDKALMILEEVKRMKKEMKIKTDYIFSEDGFPVDYQRARRAMIKACRLADLPEYKIYVFRKTWITAMVDHSGLTLAQIASLAGNSPEVIMKAYYGHREGLPDATTISMALRGEKVTKEQ